MRLFAPLRIIALSSLVADWGLGPPDERGAVSRYSRQDVLRILRLRAKQITAWERAGLIETGDSYSFQDLVKLRKLRDLRASRVSVANIRASVDAMQAVSGMSNPLLEATASRRGSRVLFRHSGAVMEPIARQFVFDFEAPAPGELSAVPNTSANPVALEARVSSLFLQAVQLEENGQIEEAADGYERVLHLDPHHAPSAINLGTICYNHRAFRRAEELYRRATVSDPGYALAFFDLAMYSTSWSGCPTRSKPTGMRYAWCRSMPMRTTTWRWPTNAPASAAVRCATGRSISSSTQSARGRTMPAHSREKSCRARN